MNPARLLVLVALVAGSIAVLGCVVEDRTAVNRPAGCAGGRWIEGHYGPRGRWHPGHWRCPGVVEAVEVE
jgi:hypothetical protein